VKRDVQQLVRKLEDQGWAVVLTGGGHLKATPPGGGAPVFMPATPSDWRSLKNSTALLRRRGAVL
jgi:predicted RNA binding protein YcfA (HicA-like mRNA interferase family)